MGSTKMPCWPDRPRMVSGASDWPNVPTRMRPMMLLWGPYTCCFQPHVYGCCRGGGERLDPVSQCFAGAFQCCDPCFVADVLLVEDDAECFGVFRGVVMACCVQRSRAGSRCPWSTSLWQRTRWRTGLVPHWPGMVVVPVAKRQMSQTALGVVLLSIAAAACPWSSSAHWMTARKGLPSVCLLSAVAKSLYWMMGSDQSLLRRVHWSRLGRRRVTVTQSRPWTSSAGVGVPAAAA